MQPFRVKSKTCHVPDLLPWTKWENRGGGLTQGGGHFGSDSMENTSAACHLHGGSLHHCSSSSKSTVRDAGIKLPEYGISHGNTDTKTLLWTNFWTMAFNLFSDVVKKKKYKKDTTVKFLRIIISFQRLLRNNVPIRHLWHQAKPSVPGICYVLLSSCLKWYHTPSIIIGDCQGY